MKNLKTDLMPNRSRIKSAALVPEGRLVAVDIIRTVAILAVLSSHLDGFYVLRHCASPWLHAVWGHLHYNGGAGVGMFFVVSGFVITRLLASRPQGLFTPDLRYFYARRAGRLLPLLLLTCLIGVTLIAFTRTISPGFEHCFKGPTGAPFSCWLWISIATFWANWYQIISDHQFWASGMHWGLLWSLSVEEQFYFFYPVALRCLKNEDGLFYFLVVGMVLGFSANFFLLVSFPTFADISRNSFGGFVLIALGCLLYQVWEHSRAFLASHPKTSLLICVFGFVILLQAYFHHFGQTDYLWTLLDPLLIGLGVFLFLLGGMQVRFFNSRALKYATLPGQLSYGEYLLHGIVIYFLLPVLTGMNEFLGYGLLVVVVTAIAWASFRFYEGPANLWVRKLLGESR